MGILLNYLHFVLTELPVSRLLPPVFLKIVFTNFVGTVHLCQSEKHVLIAKALEFRITFVICHFIPGSGPANEVICRFSFLFQEFQFRTSVFGPPFPYSENRDRAG